MGILKSDLQRRCLHQLEFSCSLKIHGVERLGGGKKLPLILLLPLQFTAATRAAMTTTITTMLPMLHDHGYGDYDYDDDYDDYC